MGTDYEFEKDVKYNYESNISMKLEINKTCYSKGEILKGSLFLFPRSYLYQTQLTNPYAEIKLEEMHYFQYHENDYDKNKKAPSSITLEEEENITVLSENISFPNFRDVNITLDGLKIPFEVKIPQTAYPSCIFDSNAFVRHFFSVNFPSIGAKKTLVIVIKNNIFFSVYNGRLKSPITIQKEITKHKFIFFNSGFFKYSVTIPKNIFSYEEIIPFLIDIDFPNLSFNIRGIKVSIFRIYKLNRHKNHKISRYRSRKEIVNKYISFTEGEKNLHIEDFIKLPESSEELNPKTVYDLLDNERKNFNYREKYKNLRIFPACYGGLLTCDYFIKFEFDMDSWGTTNEDFIIPLDFYERFTDDIVKTPKPFELKPYAGSNDLYKNNENGYDLPNKEELNTQKDDMELPNEDEINKQKDDMELPNEDEINTKKDNNTEDYNKQGDDNYKDGDAPPPSAG